MSTDVLPLMHPRLDQRTTNDEFRTRVPALQSPMVVRTEVCPAGMIEHLRWKCQDLKDARG